MKTYPIRDEEGRLFAFEVDNAYVTPAMINRLLSSQDGVTVLQRRKLFGKFEEEGVHLSFEYQGHEFMVWEPYGDSNRYWIGPREGKDAAGRANVADVDSMFRDYTPPILMRLLGDIFTFPAKLFGRDRNDRVDS